MIDLKDISFADTAVMTVRHPLTGEELVSEGKPVTITLAGKDSAEFAKTKRDALNRRLADRSGRQVTAEEVERQVIRGLARVTMEVSGLKYGGIVIKATDKDAVESLYAKAPWLREQVDQFIDDRANFMPASSET